MSKSGDEYVRARDDGSDPRRCKMNTVDEYDIGCILIVIGIHDE